MAPSRADRRFFGLAFGSPLERVLELPIVTKGTAVLGGIVAGLIDLRVFFGLVGVLIATEWLDFWLGTQRAHRAKAYRAYAARNGRVAKIGGIILLLILRLMEVLIAHAIPAIDTHGALATAAVIAMWRAEAESAEGHIKALAGRGIPILSQVLAAFRTIEQLVMPRLPTPPPPAPTPAVPSKGGDT